MQDYLTATNLTTAEGTIFVRISRRMGLQIARQKRQENIAEYVVHMYQTEDLIRAYGLNIEEIERYVVSHFPLNEEEKKETLEWYGDLINAMKNENIVESGHLAETQQIVSQLEQLHSELGDNEAYMELVQAARPGLDEFQKLNKVSAVQTCLNAVYGLLILRLNSQPVSDEQLKHIDTFGALLSYLSYVFRQKENLSSN